MIRLCMMLYVCMTSGKYSQIVDDSETIWLCPQSAWFQMMRNMLKKVCILFLCLINDIFAWGKPQSLSNVYQCKFQTDLWEEEKLKVCPQLHYIITSSARIKTYLVQFVLRICPNEHDQIPLTGLLLAHISVILNNRETDPEQSLF